ncbi:MAG: hypothetical protein IBX71_06435 [Candidatus Desulforudis sp.]|nr:hypothetical protein [Desulforudis sp.]
MCKDREEFRILIDRSKNLAETLRMENQDLSAVDRARLIFQLRLAYNLTVSQCDDQRLARELLGLIEECEELLSS